MKLVSPKGTRIVGTVEKVYGTCLFAEDTKIQRGIGDAKDTFFFEYCGETDLDWNSQVTEERPDKDGKPQRVFFDDNGDEYLESELTLVEDVEADDSAKEN